MLHLHRKPRLAPLNIVHARALKQSPRRGETPKLCKKLSAVTVMGLSTRSPPKPRKPLRGRFPFETLKRKIMELKKRYHPSTLLIEESPISLGLIQSLREQSINVTTYKPDTDKRARLITQIDLFAGGSVRLPQRAAWLEEFVAELLAFPGGHDDQVDALTQGMAWGRRNWGRKAISRPLRGLW